MRVMYNGLLLQVEKNACFWRKMYDAMIRNTVSGKLETCLKWKYFSLPCDCLLEGFTLLFFKYIVLHYFSNLNIMAAKMLVLNLLRKIIKHQYANEVFVRNFGIYKSIYQNL